MSGQLSNSTAASQQVSTKVSQAGAVELAAKPITLVYGGTKYQLSVPAADSGGKQTNVSAVVVPGGIVWIPGGSSIGVVVSDPKNPSEKVTLWMNACAGCYSPSVVSAELVTAPDSPLLGAQKGESYTWLNDHAVTYTLPPSKKSKYPTYGLTRTFTGASGDEEVTVTVPARDKQTATDILNSVLSRPSRHA
ncbi:hypothetical protein GI364_05980 [Alicyclobacillus sp. SO9]|nr:hypothetical protein GI364_05980 [Alicyclobacillus sp. SO9]